MRLRRFNIKTYDYGHLAAKAVHQSIGAEKEFEAWGDTEKYLDMGLIVRKPKRNTSGFEYYPITDDLWYIFDSSGAQKHGPFETKSEALDFMGKDSASYEDTGLYTVDKRYIARRGVAIEQGFDVDPKAEVTK